MHSELPGCLLKYNFEPQSILDKTSIHSFHVLSLFLLKQKLQENSLEVHVKVTEKHRALYKKYE